MRVQSLSSNKNHSITQQGFKGLHVIDTEVQRKILTSLNPEQLQSLSNYIKEQQNNSVHILLGSKNGIQLNAKLMCEYQLQDFQPKYTQKLLFESKFNFIKRIVDVANEYQKKKSGMKKVFSKQQKKNIQIQFFSR